MDYVSRFIHRYLPPYRPTYLTSPSSLWLRHCVCPQPDRPRIDHHDHHDQGMISVSGHEQFSPQSNRFSDFDVVYTTTCHGRRRACSLNSGRAQPSSMYSSIAFKQYHRTSVLCVRKSDGDSRSRHVSMRAMD